METPARERWEEEIFAGHRWAALSDEEAAEEYARLKPLWEKADSINEAGKELIEQIAALELCNWNLERSILALCEAIGKKKPATIPIGHMASIDEERWRRVWAYYLALRMWLPRPVRASYEVLLKELDADGETQRRVQDMLGERDPLKELYAERFARCLEFWLSGYPNAESAQMKAHKAAAEALETEIRKLDPEARILNALAGEGDGRLNPCHHKVFRRYDIILSSIGAGEWRAEMPLRGTDGLERADTIEKYLAPIEGWVTGKTKPGGEIGAKIYGLLGKTDDVKVFLASFLASLLRAGQLKAVQWGSGETRSGWREFLEKEEGGASANT
ncbi:MAG: hypothetical protein JSW52_11565 [Candidatus Coatesbacteria bacterium]|nr:MAG: hypothetical protein JSW52_11565 [Candidatus Coatesbacteria bacterium]